MEFKNIEAFLKVVDKGSFSLAADTMFISQPTISSRIQKLEQELDTTLFVRNGGKKAILTEEGKKIYPYYKEALKWILKGNEALQANKYGFNKVNFSCPSHMGQFILPRVLKDLYTLFPNIEFVVKVSKTDQIVEDIKHGETHIGLIFLDREEETEDYSIVPIAMEKTVLVTAPNHPLAKYCPLKIGDLKDEKFIVFAKASNKHIIMDQFLKKHGLHEYNTMEIKNVEWIKIMVQSGLGISFLQKNIVQEELQNHALEELTLVQPLPATPISLIFRNEVPIDLLHRITQTMNGITF
jgi:DNA-binding transcriptional LysR family regulator